MRLPIPLVFLAVAGLLVAVARAHADEPLPPDALVVDDPDDARAPQSWWRDERGRALRVAYDPGSRITLGIATSLRAQTLNLDPQLAVVPALELGLHYRGWLASGLLSDDTYVSWQIDNHWLEGHIELVEPERALPRFDVVLYRGEYLRHDELPHITVPRNPPVFLPFPFDIGLEIEAGRLHTEPGALDDTEAFRVGVARGAVLLDPWRTGAPGNSLEIGLGARYDLDIVGALGDSPDVLNHRVAPMTATSVRWRLQDGPGLTTMDLRADLVPQWTSQSDWELGASALLVVERVLVAVNDLPLSLRLDARYDHRSPATGGDAVDSLTTRLGLVFGVPLR